MIRMAESGYPLHQLDWDTQFFGAKMGEVQLNPAETGFSFSELLWRRTLSIARKEHYRFLLCQFDANYQEIAAILIKYGATVGDVLITLDLDLDLPLATQPIAGHCTVTRAELNDLPAVLAIASNSFEYSRFFCDRNFCAERVRQFYPNWIKQSFQKSEEVFVLKESAKVLGFISLQTNQSTAELIIRLIAVDQTLRGQGFGQVLIGWAKQYALEHKAGRMVVGTQVNNIPAVRLYEKNGFRLSSAKYRFHIWMKSEGEQEQARGASREA